MIRVCIIFFFQAEDGIRDLVRSRGLGDVYKRQVLFTLDYLYHLNKKNITFFKTDTNYKVEEIEVIQSCTTRFLLYLQKEKLEFSLGLKLLKFQIMNLELSANNAIEEVIKIFDNWLHHFSDIKYELDLLVNSNKI